MEAGILVLAVICWLPPLTMKGAWMKGRVTCSPDNGSQALLIASVVGATCLGSGGMGSGSECAG